MDLFAGKSLFCTKIFIQERFHRQQDMKKADCMLHNYVLFITISESGSTVFYLPVVGCVLNKVLKLAVYVLLRSCCKHKKMNTVFEAIERSILYDLFWHKGIACPSCTYCSLVMHFSNFFPSPVCCKQRRVCTNKK